MKATIGLVLLAACSSSSSTPQQIQIGFLAPLTGDIAAFGRDLTNASNLALEEINNGGGVLGGRALSLEVYDTGTSPTGASLGYTQLLNAQVPVILGPTASSEVLAVADQVQDGSTLTISQSATSPQISTTDFGGYFYRLAPSDAVQAVVLAQQITAKAPSGICIAYRDDAYGTALEALVAAKISTPVTTASYDPTATDLSHVLDPCDSLMANPTSAIMFISFIADGAALLDDAADRGWNSTTQQVFLTDGTENMDLESILQNPSFVEGAIGTMATGPDPTTPAGAVMNAFQQRFLSRYGYPADVYTEQSYDAVYVAAMAMELAGGTDDHEQIKNEIPNLMNGSMMVNLAGEWQPILAQIEKSHSVGYKGPSGVIQFNLQTGDLLPPYYISIWTVSGGAVVVQQVVEVDSM
jgi:branched-chain amino acid transport system substrate-binding protein